MPIMAKEAFGKTRVKGFNRLYFLIAVNTKFQYDSTDL